MRAPLVVSAVACLLLALPTTARGDTSPSSGPVVAESARPPAPGLPAAREVVASDGSVARPRSIATQSETGLPLEGTRVFARALHQWDTRIGAGLGDYAVTRLTADVRVAKNLSSRFQLAGDLAAERGTFDFSNPAGLVPVGVGDLGGSMTGLRAGLGASWSISRAFGVTLGATARWLWMDGADIGDSVQPGVLAAVRLRLFGSTDVFVGGSFTKGLEGDPYVLPVLGLGGGAGGADSRWHVEARGAGFGVTYDLTSCLTLGLVVGYERRDVRLAPDDRLPDGVLRERRLPVSLEVGWRMRRESFLLLSAGASVWNRITLLDSDGTVVTVETTDPAPFMQLEWTARF